MPAEELTGDVGRLRAGLKKDSSARHLVAVPALAVVRVTRILFGVRTAVRFVGRTSVGVAVLWCPGAVRVGHEHMWLVVRKAVLDPPELEVELAELVLDVLVELELVEASGTDVTPGPVENPGELVSPHP